MSRQQIILHIFMENQKGFFLIDHIRYIRFTSSQVGFPGDSYTKNRKNRTNIYNFIDNFGMPTKLDIYIFSFFIYIFETSIKLNI